MAMTSLVIALQRADERQHEQMNFLGMRTGQLVYCYYLKHLGEEDKQNNDN